MTDITANKLASIACTSQTIKSLMRLSSAWPKFDSSTRFTLELLADQIATLTEEDKGRQVLADLKNIETYLGLVIFQMEEELYAKEQAADSF